MMTPPKIFEFEICCNENGGIIRAIVGQIMMVIACSYLSPDERGSTDDGGVLFGVESISSHCDFYSRPPVVC